jgi:hypothetical protein
LPEKVTLFLGEFFFVFQNFVAKLFFFSKRVCVVTGIFDGYYFNGVIQTCHQLNQNLHADNFDPSFTSLNMGLKRGAIGNTLREQIGNQMGTSWEQKKTKKIFPPPPLPPPPKI